MVPVQAPTLSLQSILLQEDWSITREAKRAQVNPLLLGHNDISVDEERATLDFLASIRAPHFITPSGDTIQLADAAAQDKVVVGSVGVVPLKGVLVKDCPAWAEKYFGLCSSERFAADMLRMAADARVKTILVPVEGPGGHVAGVEKAHTAILTAKASKPVFGHTESLNASAHYFVSSACSKMYLSGRTDVVGSLGVMCSIYDDSKWLADIGLTEIDVYADQSTRKNEEIRAALGTERDLSKLKRSLTERCALLLGMAQAARPKLSPEALTGATFLADAAVANGLADGIMAMDAVVQMALNEKTEPTTVNITVDIPAPGAPSATQKEVQTTPPTGPETPAPAANNTMSKFTAAIAAFTAFVVANLKGAEADPTPDELKAYNEAIAKEGVKGVEMVGTNELVTLRGHEKALNDLKAANELAAKARTDKAREVLKAHAKPVADTATSEQVFEALMAHVTELGKTAAGAQHTTPPKAAEDKATPKWAGHDEALEQINGASTGPAH